MRTSSRNALVSLLSTFALLISAVSTTSAQAASAASKANATKRAATPKLKWGPGPANLPKGAKAAVVSGDPSKTGPFEIQLALPNRYTVPPHFHPTDETVTVKSGTFLYGMGDKIDPKQMKTMKVGESGTMQANAHHYAMARGKTVVSVSGMGPFVTTYVNPADDPTNKKK